MLDQLFGGSGPIQFKQSQHLKRFILMGMVGKGFQELLNLLVTSAVEKRLELRWVVPGGVKDGPVCLNEFREIQDLCFQALCYKGVEVRTPGLRGCLRWEWRSSGRGGGGAA